MDFLSDRYVDIDDDVCFELGAKRLDDPLIVEFQLIFTDKVVL